MNVIRRPLTLMLLAMLIIGGCSESADKPEEKEEKEEKQTVLQYEGKPLNIAVVGEDGPADFPGVTYHTYSMQNLANKDQLEYDAIIVMKSEFEEAAKKTFTPFFNSVDIPVFVHARSSSTRNCSSGYASLSVYCGSPAVTWFATSAPCSVKR